MITIIDSIKSGKTLLPPFTTPDIMQNVEARICQACGNATT